MNRRVVSDGRHFYPQQKGWFFWKFYYEPGYPQLDGLEVGPEIVRFDKLQDAIGFFHPIHPSQVDVVWRSV